MTGATAPVIFAIAVIGLLSLLPIARLLVMAVAPAGTLDLTIFIERLFKLATQRAALNTIDTAFCGAVVALAIGVPFALLVSMSDMPGRKLSGFLLLLPLMIAPQVTALSWIHMLGPSSTLLGLVGLAPPPGSPNPLLGRGGIIVLYGFQHAPIVFVTLRAGLARIPRDYVEAARASGAPPWRVLLQVVLPLAGPYLVAGAALAFVSGIGNFGIPALLGLPVNYLTLTTLIYQQLSSFGPGALPQVASLSIMIGALALLGVAVQVWALRGRGHRFAAGRPARFSLGAWRLPVTIVVFVFLFAIIALPLAALLTTSLIPAYGVPLNAATLTLDNYVEVLTRQAATMRAFVNSTVLASGAALILALGAIPVAAGLARLPRRGQNLMQGLAELPYALPGIVLSIACILLFLRPLPLVGSLYASLWIILIAYLMRFQTLALRPVATAIGQISHELVEAAAASGARPLRRLVTITAPLAAPAAAAGALLVLMSAFNELTVSALLWSGGHETLGVILFSLEESGLSPQAAAIAIATIVVVVLLLLLVDRLGRRLPVGVLPWR
ncbi:MAG TPA: iron ABC transporter permease [Devosiaceae bacterium]|jgi:iron(III) transport system permease protein